MILVVCNSDKARIAPYGHHGSLAISHVEVNDATHVVVVVEFFDLGEKAHTIKC